MSLNAIQTPEWPGYECQLLHNRSTFDDQNIGAVFSAEFLDRFVL